MQILEATDSAPGNARRCKHCSRPLAPAQDVFCCPGCETVNAILAERGWDEYYRLQEMFDAQAPDLRDRFDDNYAYLATDEYFEQHVQTSGTRNRTIWFIKGLTCGACVWLIERVLDQSSGVLDYRLTFASGQLELDFTRDADLVGIATHLDQFGYRVALNEDRLAGDDGEGELLRLGVAGALAANVMLMTLPFYIGLQDGWYAGLFAWITCVLSAPVLAYCARPFFAKAFALLTHGAFSIDVPIVIGLISAEALSLSHLLQGEVTEIYFDSVAMLVFFLLVGRYLQQRGTRKALEATRSLIAGLPQLAEVLRDGTWRWVTASQVRIGDTIRLLSGDLSCVDGRLASDLGTFNCQVVSGESNAVESKRGDFVPAGAINIGGPVEIQASSTHHDSDVARLRTMVDGLKRNQTQDDGKLAYTFTAVVVVLATAAFATRLEYGVTQAMKTALTILIVACPCALALSRPIATAFAMARAARNGIWVKSVDAFKRAQSVDQILLDKTGVLTDGHPEMVARQWFYPRKHWLKGAILALEEGVRHPISDAFRTTFGAVPAVGEPSRVAVVPGAGVSGEVDGHEILICAPHAIESMSKRPPSEALIKRALDAVALPADAGIVIVLVDDQLAFACAFRDQVRAEAKGAIDALKARRLQVGIISGDRQRHVTDLGESLGIDRALGEISPRGKLDIVASSLSRGRGVAVVGDGLNDMGALARATLGITHAKATSAALQFADVVIKDGDLMSIAGFLDHAKLSERAVTYNLTTSLAYNSVAIALAWLGMIGPLWAAILMPLSSLSVTAQTAWITRRRRRPWAF